MLLFVMGLRGLQSHIPSIALVLYTDSMPTEPETRLKAIHQELRIHARKGPNLDPNIYKLYSEPIEQTHQNSRGPRTRAHRKALGK